MNPIGSPSYETVKAAAQTMANATGLEYGVERMVAGRAASGRVIWYAVRILPAPEYRQGAELWCEVVGPVGDERRGA